ncbi:membrane protein [Pseudorhodobacter ferrugineus]|uniref:membrane protein n=1 Tax=Pseudorhodobacter ferrugineus TaxID=77008 RepID=UPI0003B2FE54|nr:membrane protein [Pseudorhodobacter ferrugineus]
MPNALAYIMLLIWPIIAVALFRRLPREKALIWSILAAYMILPPIANINLPAVPDLDKFAIANLCALGLTVWVLHEKVSFLPSSLIGRVLIILYVVSPFATALTNTDPIPIVMQDVPALRMYDSVATISYQFIALIPFFLARQLLRSEAALKVMVGALVTAGLIYSLPMLLESRISPQLNIWVYGFFQHDFSQSMRAGGFRPMVFMPHGLWVAFFALMAAMSALIILRMGEAQDRPKQLAIFLYLALVLYTCKSVGPLVYALGLTPVIFFAPRRWQLLLAAGLAVVVITYPLLRGAGLIPLDIILDYALSLSPERHQSLNFRIMNEEELLARAALKPYFGWGGYGRNLILDAFDGRILTIPDGQWIIVLGTYGWLGYICEFGLLIMPLIFLGREALLQRSAAFSPFACTIALIYAANLADLLPNATLIPFTWLMAGALMGYAESLATQRRHDAAAKWKAGLAQGSGPRTVL